MKLPGASSNQPRSETVRARRSSRSQERNTNTTQRLRYASEAPSVLIRGRAVGTPVVRRASTPVRRKMSISLGMPGAEMEMPSLPVIHFGWRLISGMMVVVLTLLLMLIFTAPELEINELEVNGLQRIKAVDIAAVLNTQGMRIYEFNPAAAKLALQKAFPELKDIQVEMALPAHISITASERQPIVAWKDGDDLVWIDVDGYMFTPRGDIGALLTIEADNLPIIKVPLNPQQAENNTQETAEISDSAETPVKIKKIKIVDPKILSAAIRLSKELPPETVLTYNEQNGLGWNAHEGWYVFIGRDLNNLDEKLAIYNHIADMLKERNENPGLINVANINAPYYRLEQ